jgi:integrase/recombinase XerD
MLRVSDIDSERMLIRVEMGKGRKDRHAKLSPEFLSLLRAWWLQCRSKGWLFPGRDPLLPMTVRQLNRVCHMAAEAAGLGSWVTPHTLRHSFATHLKKLGVLSPLRVARHRLSSSNLCMRSPSGSHRRWMQYPRRRPIASSLEAFGRRPRCSWMGS